MVRFVKLVGRSVQMGQFSGGEVCPIVHDPPRGSQIMQQKGRWGCSLRWRENNPYLGGGRSQR